ncbi:uncharacterized protein ACMZJ9_005222 isoform 2-T2 [Mantella aurantiaca]
MTGGPGKSQPLGYQGSSVNGTEDFRYGNLHSASIDWRSPPNITNGGSIPAGPTSGLVPGLIAAGIFIMFLLCLYAILWKCMVSPPNKKRRKRKVTSPPPKKTLVV